VDVEVRDNGKGFEASVARPSTHGLAGMRHRVEAAGGRLHVVSHPGEGTRIRASLPKPAPSAPAVSAASADGAAGAENL
jgi:signal transduction histidine kinase